MIKTSPLNYLVIEILTILYPLFLLVKNIYPIVMVIIIIIHSKRLYQNYQYVNMDISNNLFIVSIYFLLVCGLFKTKKFLTFGLLFGLFQYITYRYHEKQTNVEYNYLELYIDIPITLFSFIVSYDGFLKNDVFMVPFMGDFIYHILEIIFHIIPVY